VPLLAFSAPLPHNPPRDARPDATMIDYAQARQTMVDCQIRPSDVTDLPLLEALLAVPRERFLPPPVAELAYLDLDLPIAGPPHHPTRRLIKPQVLAKLLQAAEIAGSDRVLDVGCATGYSSAVLARLAKAVVALEEDPELLRQARAALAGIGSVELVEGRLTSGWPSGAPYDAVVLNGATEIVPEALLQQLANGGRLVCVLGRGQAAKATLFRRVNGALSDWPIFDCAAPLLPGFVAPPAFVF
jgi:protein-L-isoaspartate(D-aspartate) O-methyltransferase